VTVTTTREESGLVAVPRSVPAVTCSVTLIVCNFVLEPIAEPSHTQPRKLFGNITIRFYETSKGFFTDLVGGTV
jgi:hypothetical protein